MLNTKQKLRRQTTQSVAQKFQSQSFEILTESEAKKVTGGFTFKFLPFELVTSLIEIEF
ncbi:hypothetical protein QUB80_32370 [Chlorogloeopsis sp. ULAP01]|uniref:hypothetical protein n=1 Tax=Chlorogloeopsis sp. ULAP01 TaxID=3056483 RepID=UPI0025AA425E|nr:hypothetical protein [Chlorogloeopsis sp. ULAP01]MDM9385351.1 hypothetical protein [Chlorogloeopsis sp. ULAP01]